MNEFKSILKLNNDNLNEFYTLLTKEGQEEINFEDIKGLIKLIKINRVDFFTDPIFLSENDLEFLKVNFENLSMIKKREEFFHEFFEKLKKKNFIFDNWNSLKVNLMYNKFQNYLISKNQNVNDFFDKNFRIDKKKPENKSCNLKKFSEKKNYLKTQLKYFIQEIKKIKNNNLKFIFKDLLVFAEIFDEKMQDLFSIYKSKDLQIIENLTKIENMEEILQSKEKLIYENFNENNDLIITNKELEEENKKLNYLLKEIKNKYNIKEKEYEKLYENMNIYEKNFEDNKKLLRSLSLENNQFTKKVSQLEINLKTKDEILEKNLRTSILVSDEKEKINKEIKNYELKMFELKKTNQSLIFEKENFLEEIQEKNLNIEFLRKKLDEKNNSENEKIKNVSNLEEFTESFFETNMNMSILTKSDYISVNKSDFILKKSFNDNLDKNEDIKIEKEVYPEKIINNYNKINSLIREKSVKIENNNNFKDFVYICQKDFKKMYFFKYFKSSNIIEFIHTEHKNKILLNIKIENIMKIEISNNNKFLFKIFYKKSKSNKNTDYLLIECLNLNLLIEKISLNKKLKKNIIKKIDYFEIENNQNFNSKSLYIFSNNKTCGFLKLWVNNLFYNWKIYFFIIFEKTLIKFSYPRTIYYEEKENLFKKIRMYRLDNFILIRSKKKKSNVFVLKFNNEKKDLIINSLSKNNMKKWIKIFYRLFDKVI